MAEKQCNLIKNGGDMSKLVRKTGIATSDASGYLYLTRDLGIPTTTDIIAMYVTPPDNYPNSTIVPPYIQYPTSPTDAKWISKYIKTDYTDFAPIPNTAITIVWYEIDNS
jgi:hypothetical protein